LLKSQPLGEGVLRACQWLLFVNARRETSCSRVNDRIM
jgi:hypothetical protein